MRPPLTKLRERFNNHRSNFYGLLRKVEENPNFVIDVDGIIDDEHILGAHLILKHNKKCQTDFNDVYKVDVLSFCNPDVLHLTEQSYIEKLSTLKPFELNQIKSIGGR